MNNIKLLHVTTALDPWYRLSAFLSYLKNNVKEQLKLNAKKHKSFEVDQSGDSPILLSEKLKPQPSVNFVPKKFWPYSILFKIDTATREDEQQDIFILYIFRIYLLTTFLTLLLY